MRKILPLILLLISIKSIAQTVPTTSDIFDFNIGDEFQYKYPLAPPNVSRMIILNKYFSNSGDTVFYVRQNDNYYSTATGGIPPTLNYFSSSFVDTIYYSNLLSPIPFFTPVIFNDSCDSSTDSIYSSSSYCNSTVYRYLNCIDCCFEGESYEGIYGIGKGLMMHDYQNIGNNSHQRIEQIFYHKAFSNDSCGIADRSHYNITGLTKSVINNEFLVYPNPTEGKLFIKHREDFTNKTTFKVFNILGNLVDEPHLDTDKSIDISSLEKGIYFLNINGIVQKIIKK